MTEYYQVGKIVNTKGLDGTVKVISSTDFAESRFKKGSHLFIMDTTGPIEVEVVKHQKQKNFDILKFKEFDSINQVEKFKGDDLKISADQRTEEELADDEFYYDDIIGLEVIDVNDSRSLGTVKEILSPGPNDVWVVKRTNENDLLIPFLKDVMVKIDVPEKKAYVDLPEGLE